MIKVSAQSREEEKVGPVFAKLNGSQINPSTNPPSAAVVLEGVTPQAGDYAAQSWDVDTSGVTPKYYILVDIGPGSTIGSLTAGKVYDIWVSYTLVAKTVVSRIGSISVYP
jgi:hypothetical protein